VRLRVLHRGEELLEHQRLERFAAIGLRLLELRLVHVGVDEVFLGVIDDVELELEVERVLEEPLELADRVGVGVTAFGGLLPHGLGAGQRRALFLHELVEAPRLRLRSPC
jgi:hypothetical protein